MKVKTHPSSRNPIFLLPRLVMRWVVGLVERQLAQPIPGHWLPIIKRRVPATRELSAQQVQRLLPQVRQLLQTLHWEACAGLTLTEEMELVIGAQACLLTLALPGEPYPTLKEILIYPRAFVPKPVDVPGSPPTSTCPQPVLAGEAWSIGTVVLAWDEVAEGALEPGDAYNPVYHEFAHLLDFQHALTPYDNAWTDPLTEAHWNREPSVADPVEWRRVLEESYEQRCAARERGVEDVLREYAASNKKEFFAVATEAFFERPHDLRAAYPALYAQLESLYDQDPAGPYGTLR